MSVRKIIKLGDSRLWKKCFEVKNINALETKNAIQDLENTLADFTRKNGFGRGIAAPQIGKLKRIIYVHFPEEGIDGAFINPRIVKKSRQKFRLWDDCFSFPNLLVRVERASMIEVEFVTEKGERRRIKARKDLSELLQHEIDHLDGILAVQRAVDKRSFALRGGLGKSGKR